MVAAGCKDALKAQIQRGSGSILARGNLENYAYTATRGTGAVKSQWSITVAPVAAENPPRSSFLAELDSLLENMPRTDVLRWSEARLEAGFLKHDCS